MRVAWMLGVAMGTLVVAGCGELGTGHVSSLPRDVHAAPDAQDLADHPCRYGDVGRCIARCVAGRDAQSCNAAGVMFEFDSGESSDAALASGFYTRACEDSYAPGCNNLAWLYLRGNGVPQDQPHAMLLFMAAFDAAKLACLRGDTSNCLLAGELLYDQHAEPKDGDTAVAFFRKACDGGEPKACQLAADE
ncbi:MAG TPA: tetratricopeptide repeat protein [Polyangiaceae bacterium]